MGALLKPCAPWWCCSGQKRAEKAEKVVAKLVLCVERGRVLHVPESCSEHSRVRGWTSHDRGLPTPTFASEYGWCTKKEGKCENECARYGTQCSRSRLVVYSSTGEKQTKQERAQAGHGLGLNKFGFSLAVDEKVRLAGPDFRFYCCCVHMYTDKERCRTRLIDLCFWSG